MTHDYHEMLPGFDERQIWHDGCEECEQRGERVAIDMLDAGNFARAWQRAFQFNKHGGSDLAISRAERPLLMTLWRVQVQLERQGWPLGHLPIGDVFAAAVIEAVR